MRTPNLSELAYRAVAVGLMGLMALYALACVLRVWGLR